MYQFKPVTERVQRLRTRFRSMTLGDSMPACTVERARLTTEFYQAHEADAPIIKRAELLKYLLENVTVRVWDDELIVGNLSPEYHGSILWPELGIDWLFRELTDGTFDKRTHDLDAHSMTQEARDYVMSIRDYWEPRSVSARVHATAPDGLKKTYGSGVLAYAGANMACNPTGHFCSNFTAVCDEGFGAIKARAQAKLDELGDRLCGDEVEKYFFYKSIVITCEGCIIYSKRLAAECRRMAEAASDSRRAELLQMAESLDWIMEKPVRTYHEAVQAVYLYQLIMSIDGNMHGMSYGRVDQYVGKYLEADLAAGRIDLDRAQEIMDCFFLKVSDCCKMWSAVSARSSGGYTTGQNMTVGGQTKDGRDATNEASYLMLEAVQRLKLREPPLSLRIHSDTPSRLWEAGMLTAMQCGGIPLFENDDTVIAALTKKGISIEDARNYCIIGCVEPSVGGSEWPACGGSGKESYLNLVNALVLALNNGTNPFTGAHAGLETGYLYDMTSFDEVKAAYKKQMEYFVDWHVTMTNIAEQANAELQPKPIVSATMEGCLDSGRDVTKGGARLNSTGISGIGAANIADALAAIKYFVFDTKKYTAREFYDAVMSNWEGREAMRQDVLNAPVHFGNDIDWVDELARWSTDVFSNRANEAHNIRGGTFAPGLYPVTLHVVYGKTTWATPDGRRTGEPLADGISPKQGSDKSGPLAIARSCSRLHQENNRNGTLLNMKFHPKSLEGQGGLDKLRALIQSYFDLGGMHLQYNVVSSDTLRAAQKRPEDYSDLVVRVAGFSAYFVELYPELQDDVIRRNEIAF